MISEPIDLYQLPSLSSPAQRGFTAILPGLSLASHLLAVVCVNVGRMAIAWNRHRRMTS
ncbi:hypothetical protein BDZ90DRAFT_2708 [Jaminaea rosea]|uniref:Uncharacterized protein n=1 Tax=Jaminaea rosea TaxID=1569628 RepID=A0A316UXG3_9BASI|nr:hypothetical protein BDZ90DRAFT_2708 [Jaminaea rosea]PWN30007.1 hypothetical protein BDZ90DRAFT_2708 [Jaminaea rosea]